MEAAGIIRRYSSPWLSLLHMVKNSSSCTDTSFNHLSFERKPGECLLACIHGTILLKSKSTLIKIPRLVHLFPYLESLFLRMILSLMMMQSSSWKSHPLGLCYHSLVRSFLPQRQATHAFNREILTAYPTIFTSGSCWKEGSSLYLCIIHWHMLCLGFLCPCG